jgi:uncharacterized RDD family membrane protein YckC
VQPDSAIARREAARGHLFPRRAAALVIDAAVLTLVGFVALGLVTFLAGTTLRAEPVADATASTWRAVLNSTVLSGLSAGYFVLSWHRARATVGQRALRLIVVDASSGASPQTRQALTRWLLMGWPFGWLAAATIELPLAFLAVSALSAAWFFTVTMTTAFSRGGRGIHDRLTGTAVRSQS